MVATPPPPRVCLRTFLALCWLCALAVLGGLGGGAGEGLARAGDAPPPPAYVGGGVCANCHPAAHAMWSGASHAHTFEPADGDNMPADVLAGAVVEHPPGRTQFRAEAGRFDAVTAGPDGKPTRYPLTHVVGRMRVRMFISTLPDGRMQVLPGMLEVPTDAWFDYTHLLFGGGGDDWDTPPVVAPGDPSSWVGPVRSWDARCARCHVSGYAPRRPTAEGTPRYVSRALGVDCESCHGPGADHVEFREAKMEDGDPILRFGELAHDRALGVCLQCHMEGEVVRPDFVPGEDVFEARDPTLLVDPERVDPSGRPLELIYDGLPFSVSQCVQEGRLTCVTCHDPHGSEHSAQLRMPPDDPGLCGGCHEAIADDPAGHARHAADGPGATCVSCHMPFLRIERGHGVVADHSISTPRFDLEGDRVAQNACVWCHAGGLAAPPGAPQLGEADLRKAYATWWPDASPSWPWSQALGRARLGQPEANLGLLAVLEQKDNPRVVRASAAELLGRYARRSPLALLAYARSDEDSLVRRRAVAALAGLRGPAVDAALLRAIQSDASLAVRVAAARTALEGWERVQANAALLAAALPVLAADAAADPADDLRWFRLGAARSLAGDLRGALAAYERVAELDPFATGVRTEIERLRQALAKGHATR